MTELATRLDGSYPRCPGLDGLGCSEPKKKGQTYCPSHNRQYQRERYRGTRTAAGLTYTERDYTRVETDSRCGSCDGVFKEGLVVPHGMTELPPICIQCRDFVELAHQDFGIVRLIAISEFITRHREQLSERTEFTKAFEAEIERRFEEYYQEKKARWGGEDREGWRVQGIPYLIKEYQRELIEKAGKPVQESERAKNAMLRRITKGNLETRIEKQIMANEPPSA